MDNGQDPSTPGWVVPWGLLTSPETCAGVALVAGEGSLSGSPIPNEAFQEVGNCDRALRCVAIPVPSELGPQCPLGPWARGSRTLHPPGRGRGWECW